MRLVTRLWQAVRARRRERQLRFELPGLDEAIDTTPPQDVEPVAHYLWAATCWDRQSTDPAAYALAAVIWLNYGLVRLPDGSRPLDDNDLRGMPALPYRDRTDVAPTA